MDEERQNAVTGRVPLRPGQHPASRWQIINMKTLFKILATVSIVGLVLGLSDVGDSMFSGFCRAFGAIFFILAFITKTIDKAEHNIC